MPVIQMLLFRFLTVIRNLCKAAELKGEDDVYIACGNTSLPVLRAEAKSTDNFIFTCTEWNEQNSSWLPALVLAVYENRPTVNLSLETYNFSDPDREFRNVFLPEETRRTINETYPVNFIEEVGNELRLSFDFVVDETLPQSVISASKNIYNLIDFDNSAFTSVAIYFIDEQGEERCRVFFRKNIAHMYTNDEIAVGFPYIHGIFQGGRIEKDHQTFLDLIAEDEFFQKLNHYEDNYLFFD